MRSPLSQAAIKCWMICCGLADHLEVCVRVKMRTGGHVRPTNAYWLAVQVGEIDQVDEIRLLVEHAADHHEIGPVEVGVRQRLGVTVDETDVPNASAAWRRP